MTPNGRKRLEQDEGFRAKMYKCPTGHLSIGYGFNLEVQTMPKAVADLWMDMLLAEIEIELTDKLPFYQGLKPEVQDVLVNLRFNLGMAGLMEFKKTLFFIGNSQWKNAADELMDSEAARLLPKRYGELAEILRKQS